jgi:hypothetical protein
MMHLFKKKYRIIFGRTELIAYICITLKNTKYYEQSNN